MKKVWFLSVAALAVAASVAQAASPAVCLYEWNCVGDDKWLGNVASDATYFDTTFKAHSIAKKMGNGGNWFEVMVTVEDTDLQGYVFEWANDDPDSGSVTVRTNVASAALLGALTEGRIVSIMEAEDEAEDFGQGFWGDTSPRTDGATGHIHILVSDDDYLDHSGGFKADNDNWRMQIKNGSGTVVQGWVGEDITATGWTGSAINSNQSGALMVNPTITDISVIPGNYYKDTSKTSYNAGPNFDVSHD